MRVRVTYLRSLGATTDPDLTGRVRLPFEGELVCLEVGAPLRVVRTLRKRRQYLCTTPVCTTPVQSIEQGTALAEVTTQRSVYRVRFLGGPDGQHQDGQELAPSGRRSPP